MLKNISADFRGTMIFLKKNENTVFLPSMILTLMMTYVLTQYAPGFMPLWMASAIK